MKIKVLVEKTDGIYYGATKNIPGTIVADGTSFEQMKVNLLDALDFYKEDCDKETRIKLNGKIQFVYNLSLKDFFDNFKVINKSKFAERIGLSPSLLRQYTSKKEIYISENRATQIEKEIRLLGEELLSISFYK